MTGDLKMSDKSTTTDAHRIGGERVAETHCERIPGWIFWPNACAAAALASVLFVGIPGEAVAQTPGAVWAGCKLDPGTVDALRRDMSPGSPDTFGPDGGIVVLIALTLKENNGQEFAAGPNEGQFTGPVICINRNADEVFKGVGIAEILQTDPIPHPDSGAKKATSLDAQSVLIIRHELNDGPRAGEIEQVVCPDVDNQNQCFLISKRLR
jgi:hypothetical protein